MSKFDELYLDLTEKIINAHIFSIENITCCK